MNWTEVPVRSPVVQSVQCNWNELNCSGILTYFRLVQFIAVAGLDCFEPRRRIGCLAGSASYSSTCCREQSWWQDLWLDSIYSKCEVNNYWWSSWWRDLRTRAAGTGRSARCVKPLRQPTVSDRCAANIVHTYMQPSVYATSCFLVHYALVSKSQT